jgi:hypothetical protein
VTATNMLQRGEMVFQVVSRWCAWCSNFRSNNVPSIHIVYATPVRFGQIYSLRGHTLEMVDSLISGTSLSTKISLYWRIAFSEDAPGQGKHLRDFAKFVRQGMPCSSHGDSLSFNRPAVAESRKWPAI